MFRAGEFAIRHGPSEPNIDKAWNGDVYPVYNLRNQQCVPVFPHYVEELGAVNGIPELNMTPGIERLKIRGFQRGLLKWRERHCLEDGTVGVQ